MKGPRFEGVQVIRHQNVPENLNEFFTHLQLEDSKTGLIKTKYKDKSLYDIPLELVQDDYYFRIDFSKSTDEIGKADLKSDMWDEIVAADATADFSEYLNGGLLPNYNIDDIFSIEGDTFTYNVDKFYFFDYLNNDGSLRWNGITYKGSSILDKWDYRTTGTFYVYFENESMFKIESRGESNDAGTVSDPYIEITPTVSYWQNYTRYTRTLNNPYRFTFKTGLDGRPTEGAVTIRKSPDGDVYHFENPPEDWFKLSKYFSNEYINFFQTTFGTAPFYITAMKKQVILGSDGLLISDGKTQWKNGVVTTIS